MIKRFSKQILFTAVALLLAVYLFVQIYLSLSVTYDVENVYMTSFESKRSLDIYIFRDEEPIYSDGAGNTNCYPVNDGEKVHKGQVIVTTYRDKSDAQIQEKINVIDQKIEILEKSNDASLYTSNDLGKIENSISSAMINVIKCINNKNIKLSAESVTDVSVLFNNKYAVMSGITVLENAIKSLQAEKDDLEAQLADKGNDVKATMPGYFYSTADGFEKHFTEKALEELTLDKFNVLKEQQPDSEILNGSIGKIAYSSKWFIACCMTKRQANGLKEGKEYEFTFPNSFGARIAMQFERKITQSDSDTVIMVFSSNILKDKFDFSRKQTAEFVFETYDGLKVPTDAVRYLDGRNVVYALEGSKVVFKEIKIKSVQSYYCIVYLPDDYTTEEETIVKERITEATKEGKNLRGDNGELLEEYRYHQKLDLYDAVIIGGKDLKEGIMLR